MLRFFLIVIVIDTVLASDYSNTALDIVLLPEDEEDTQEYKIKQTVFLTVEIIRNEGYKAETHNVTTVDGYILEMHRIPYPKHEISGNSARPVVFLMHGLSAASNSFIYLGPKHALAYNLADAGFDVWMGNARGTKNSRFHVTMDPDNARQHKQFFDFTWEEIGLYDVSAMVDYILHYTKRSQLHYIGHSQGGTVFLVLTSMRPEYNEKFASAHLLAGVGYQEHFPDKNIKTVSSFTDFLYSTAQSLGVVELFPSNSTNVMEPVYALYDAFRSYWNVSSLCESEYMQYLGVCYLMGIQKTLRNVPQSRYIGSKRDSGNENVLRGGGSFKQVAHFGQNIRDNAFRRWNFGKPLTNIQNYGTPDPTTYNLKLITTNVTMYYTVSDVLLDERDVLSMVRVMPNAVARKIARDSFLHEDFVAAEDVKELVTNHIIEAIKYVEAKSAPNLTSSTTKPEPNKPFENIIPGSAVSSNLDVIFKLYLMCVSLHLFKSL